MWPQRSSSAGLVVAALASTAACASCADTTTQAHIGWGPRELEAEQRCQRGTVTACGELGRLLVEHHEADKDIERGFVLLEIACGQDDIPSCAVLGRQYIDRTHARARARAYELLVRACGEGAAEACTGLGQVLQIERAQGSTAAADPVAAFRKGCALGDAEGCERFGQARLRDTFGDGRAQAEEAFAKACGLRRLSGCHLLAMLMAGDPARRERGLELLQLNCQRGHVPSCSTAAAAFAPLLSGRPDCGVALRLAQRACELKDDEACAIADACALGGQAREATLESLRAACARGVATGCLYWADAQPVGADAERVEKAYEIACRGESAAAPVACPRLAVLALARAKLTVDVERPLEQLRDACEHGSAEACCGLADEYERGKWVPADATKASELRGKACTPGHDQDHDRCCQKNLK